MVYDFQCLDDLAKYPTQLMQSGCGIVVGLSSYVTDGSKFSTYMGIHFPLMHINCIGHVAYIDWTFQEHICCWQIYVNSL